MSGAAETAVAIFQVGEVGWILHVAPGGNEDEIRMPGEFGHPVRQPLDSGDAGEHVERPTEHVNGAGRVLADHVEHGIAQPVGVCDRVDEHGPVFPEHHPGGPVSRSDPARGVARMVWEFAKKGAGR